MTRKAAKTGPGAMVLVAIEQGFPENRRIITDGLASAILPFSSRLWVRLSLPIRRWLVATTEQKVPGLWGGIMARKRFIDEFLGQYGWRIREHLGYDVLGERYVKPTGRDLTWMAIERIVDAVKVQ